jgi:UDPglucose 6-dehydrogenase
MSALSDWSHQGRKSRAVSDPTYCGNAYETMDGANALAPSTEWNEFRALDLDRVKTF